MGRGDLFVRMKFADSDVKKIALGCISSQGARDYQEDSFGFSSVKKADIDAYGFTAVVADGMGGLGGGAQVSAYVVSSMLEMQKNRDVQMPPQIYLSQALCTVNRQVLANGIKGGSTAVVVMCTPKGIHWCTAGDSRVYLFREHALTMLNEDGDYMNRLMEQVISGEVSIDEVEEDRQKDALAQYIGYHGELKPDGNTKALVPEKTDKLLLCSDGVYNALGTEELGEALAKPAAEAAEEIQRRVYEKGYTNQDNFTAVVLEFLK